MAAGRIQGIAGVFIWTERARFEEMACFYRDRLGLTPRTAKPDFINFDWAGLRLSVSVHDRVQGASRDPFRIMLNLLVVRIMLNLLVDDIAAAHTRLIAAGVVFTRSPETEDWGGRVATFLDPDGNIL
jgi:catechol 2,3-dioxygenase-like lactoylglutathione lyase family enzyme